MKKIFLLGSALLSLICEISQAQESKKFLSDYFSGGAAEQTQIVRNIDEFVIARETGRQAVLLSHCKNFKTLDTSKSFDSYTEDLKKILTAKSATLNALTGFTTLSSSAALNEFSNDDIKFLKVVMARKDYADMISYLWFENGMRQLTDGLIDINTNIKQPWIAARALQYLENHQLYPLFLSTLSTTEKNLLNQKVFTSLQPAAIAKETRYTDALSQLFAKQLESRALLHALSVETASFIVQLQENINPEAKRASGTLHFLGNTPTDLVCNSSDKKNCVTNHWFKQAVATFKANELAQLDIAKNLLNDKYRSLCE